MDSDKTPPTQTTVADPSLAPADAFVRALHLLHRATDTLGAAIAAHDAGSAEAAASEACSQWLTGRTILQWLESAPPRQATRVDLLRYALRAHRRALVDLFGRADSQLASPELRRVLEQLRTSLALANDEPPDTSAPG